MDWELTIKKCDRCGKEVEVLGWETRSDGICSECLFKETNTNEVLGLNITPNGSAFSIINKLIKDINIPREQLYWFISKNKSARMYLNLDMNYWHKDCMDDSPSIPPEHVLQRMLFLRKIEDLSNQWSGEEYLEIKTKYEDCGNAN